MVDVQPWESVSCFLFHAQFIDGPWWEYGLWLPGPFVRYIVVQFCIHSLFSYKYFIVCVYVYVSVCVHMHVNADAYRSQKKTAITVAVSLPHWVLRRELGSAEQQALLTTKPSLQPFYIFFLRVLKCFVC